MTMKHIDKVDSWCGEIQHLPGRRDSPILTQIPPAYYPSPEPACATCPAKDWYLTRNGLRCRCAEKRVISWVSNEDPVLACDTRERLLEEEEAANSGLSAESSGMSER